MTIKPILTALVILFATSISAQEAIKWNNPLNEKVIQGRISSNDLPNYNRLPEQLKSQVREPVWNLGTNSAGMYVDFQTDAPAITVRYKVKGALNMSHMPTTGVSGVDLYAKDNKGTWNWAFGNYSFKDTVTYSFTSLGQNPNFTYRLYLPLYNTVEWMEIGTSSKSSFKFLENDAKPIIVYGTSIAQGACASRPGLAWTNIVGREFNNPIINLT